MDFTLCSDFTSNGSPTSAPAKKDPRIGKRKPDVDLATISDPQERRKQRRLAKNRATAATSRCVRCFSSDVCIGTRSAPSLLLGPCLT